MNGEKLESKTDRNWFQVIAKEKKKESKIVTHTEIESRRGNFPADQIADRISRG